MALGKLSLLGDTGPGKKLATRLIDAFIQVVETGQRYFVLGFPKISQLLCTSTQLCTIALSPRLCPMMSLPELIPFRLRPQIASLIGPPATEVDYNFHFAVS